MNSVKLIDIQYLGQVEYVPALKAMQAFTASRASRASIPASNTHPNTPQPNEYLHNQLWICEHPPVYTLGLAGKLEHVLNPGNIPVVHTDRGGQVTYHGPGQVVAYPLIDLRAAGFFVKEYVFRIEQALLKTLAHFGITGHRLRGAPGIYIRLNDPFGHAQLPQPVAGQALNFDHLGKIAALGIKVSRHCTYHGAALNVAMDLEPFSRINPCGYAGLQTVDMRSVGVDVAWSEVASVLAHQLQSQLLPKP